MQMMRSGDSFVSMDDNTQKSAITQLDRGNIYLSDLKSLILQNKKENPLLAAKGQYYLNKASTIDSETAEIIKFIDEMPEEYAPVWESLNEGHKQSIIAQGSFYKLDTTYQIKNFWSTRQLGTKTVGVQKLDENENTAQTATQAYSNDYMNYIASALEQKFARR